jgi:PPM family protein phosphatase
MTAIRIASRNEQGSRSRNEDALRHGSGAGGSTYAVLADGAGGHSRGAEAAQRAVQRIEAALLNDSLLYAPESLTQTVCLAHAELQEHQQGHSPEQRMHTTVVALWIDAAAQFALWTHVGDSRLYRVRHGRIDVVTSDDSVVQHLLQSGAISEEQALTHPQRNQLLTALGVEEEVLPHTVVRPVELQEGDVFLLCSDGWWDHFDPASLVGTLLQALTPEDWLETMRQYIDGRQRPRQDNYSAITLWLGDPGEVTQNRVDDTMPNSRDARAARTARTAQ